jgi:hypothetical protein
MTTLSAPYQSIERAKVLNARYIGMHNGSTLLQTPKMFDLGYKYQAWALLSADSGPYMTAITRRAKSIFGRYTESRIETHVRTDFIIGQKWVKMLGFKNETPDGMKKWGEDGFDYFMYSVV